MREPEPTDENESNRAKVDIQVTLERALQPEEYQALALITNMIGEGLETMGGIMQLVACVKLGRARLREFLAWLRRELRQHHPMGLIDFDELIQRFLDSNGDTCDD